MVESQSRAPAPAVGEARSTEKQTPGPIPIPVPGNVQIPQGKERNVLDTYSSVNQNGSFEFDRVIKSGYVQKRTQKTKAWKQIFLVLRPNTLSIYKTDKEDRLRHKIYLSDVTAVALLKDPKHKRHNVFGLFSPSKNFHFEAPNLKAAQEWVEVIRKEARIEEEEEEMFLASPVVPRSSFIPANFHFGGKDAENQRVLRENERFASSSPEPLDPPIPSFATAEARQTPAAVDSSGLSGNELASHSDFSDTDLQRLGASIDSLNKASLPAPLTSDRPNLGIRSASQVSGLNIETDPDRVVWQGRLWLLRSKGGVKQWRDLWAVLRPRNLILYKDESEYTAQAIVPLSSILSVVDIDPLSKNKTHCMQIITEEKSYKFAAHDEESLLYALGAFKSLLAKRKELEARAAAARAGAGAVPTAGVGVGAATAGAPS